MGDAQQQHAGVFQHSPGLRQYAADAVPKVLDHAKGDVRAQAAVFKIEGPHVPDDHVDLGFRFLDPCDELGREVHAGDPVAKPLKGVHVPAAAAAGLEDQAVLGQVFSENAGEFPEIPVFIPFQEAPVVR